MAKRQTPDYRQSHQSKGSIGEASRDLVIAQPKAVSRGNNGATVWVRQKHLGTVPYVKHLLRQRGKSSWKCFDGLGWFFRQNAMLSP